MTSIILAKILGVLFIVKGLSVLYKKEECIEVVSSIKDHKLLFYLVTTLELVFGLIIINIHNVWGDEAWKSLITALGWLMTIEGAYLIIAPINKTISFIQYLVKQKWLKVLALVVIFIGASLLYFGLNA